MLVKTLFTKTPTYLHNSTNSFWSIYLHLTFMQDRNKKSHAISIYDIFQIPPDNLFFDYMKHKVNFWAKLQMEHC